MAGSIIYLRELQTAPQLLASFAGRYAQASEPSGSVRRLTSYASLLCSTRPRKQAQLCCTNCQEHSKWSCSVLSGVFPSRTLHSPPIRSGGMTGAVCKAVSKMIGVQPIPALTYIYHKSPEKSRFSGVSCPTIRVLKTPVSEYPDTGFSTSVVLNDEVVSVILEPVFDVHGIVL